MNRNEKGQFIKGHLLTPMGHSRALGYRHTLEEKKKITLSKVGKKRGKFSEDWKKNMGIATKKRHDRGDVFGFGNKENNYKWNGGIAELYSRIRALKQYRWWRDRIRLQKDKCEICIGSECLEVDHYPKTFAEIIRENGIDNLAKAIECNELWSASGRILCRMCHRGF